MPFLPGPADQGVERERCFIARLRVGGLGGQPLLKLVNFFPEHQRQTAAGRGRPLSAFIASSPMAG